jgi:hypothetical protein
MAISQLIKKYQRAISVSNETSKSLKPHCLFGLFTDLFW